MLITKLVRRLAKATLYSLRGLNYAWRNEISFRLEVFFTALALVIACVFARKTADLVYLMTPLVLTLALETLNTALEQIVDEFGQGEMKRSFEIIKDCGSAAVFLMILWSVITWVFYFCLS